MITECFEPSQGHGNVSQSVQSSTGYRVSLHRIEWLIYQATLHSRTSLMLFYDCRLELLAGLPLPSAGLPGCHTPPTSTVPNLILRRLATPTLSLTVHPRPGILAIVFRSRIVVATPTKAAVSPTHFHLLVVRRVSHQSSQSGFCSWTSVHASLHCPTIISRHSSSVILRFLSSLPAFLLHAPPSLYCQSV